MIETPERGGSLSYTEWRRQKLGLPTFRSMLEADIKACIEDANDPGRFYMLLEHRGYEISHRGNRLGFRFRGQERFVCPGRKTPSIPRMIGFSGPSTEIWRRSSWTARNPKHIFGTRNVLRKAMICYVAINAAHMLVTGKGIQKSEA